MPTRDPVIVPGNLAENPSFEDGTLEPFTSTGAVTIVKGGAYDGQYAAQLKPTANAPAVIGQSLGGTKKRAIISAYYASISYLASDVFIPLSENACSITALINGHTRGYDAAPVFVTTGQTDWVQHTFYVPSDQEITSIAIGTACEKTATATIKIDGVSFVRAEGPTNGANLNLRGNLLRNPVRRRAAAPLRRTLTFLAQEFDNAGKSWTVSGDVTFDDSALTNGVDQGIGVYS